MDQDDWEDGTLPPVLSMGRHSSYWDDEDVEDNKVKESWEDEDDTTLVPMKLSTRSKRIKKVVSKASERKGKVAARDQSNAILEKLYLLSLVEGANYGLNNDQCAKIYADKSLDNFIPKSESDFFEYAALISSKLRAYEHNDYYLALLKAVIRFSMKSLRAADAKDVASSVAAIANGRLKTEKGATNRRWKTYSELRLVGRADYGSNGDQSAKSCAKKSLDNFISKSESDFFEYARFISNKLRAYEHSYWYLALLKAVMRFSMKALRAADAKDVASSVAAVANERLEAEREAIGRKRKTAASKKIKVYVEKVEDATNLDAYAALDAHKEYDSM